MRQVGVRSGWAEFFDERNGTRLYKNVLTGETTNKMPAVCGTQISETMNQRRLSWLAGQRYIAKLNDQTLAHRPVI